jgi:hypothetical protein
LIGQDAYAGCFKEHANFLSFCKIARAITPQKCKELNLHKRRKSLEEIAKEISPILRGIINYYHKFWQDDMREVLNN